MNRKSKIVLLLVVLLLTSTTIGCTTKTETPPANTGETPPVSTNGADDNEEVVTLSFVMVSASYPQLWRNHIDYMIEKLPEYTNGTLFIEEMAAGSLGGTEREITEACIQGMVDVAHLTDANMVGVMPEIGWSMVPGIFDSYEEITEIYRHGWIHEELTKQYAARGLMRLSTGDNGLRQLATTKLEAAVESLDDLKGLKIRVPDMNVLVQYWEGMGAMPVVISSSDQVSALQQGMADAIDNNIYGYPLNNVYEFAKACSLTNHVYTGSAWMINQDVYNSLSTEHQEALKRAAIEAGDILFDGIVEEERAMIASGQMEMHEVDDEFKTRSNEVGKGILENNRKLYGDELTDKMLNYMNSKH